ncbi:MAG: zinc ribbon domain-containing protein [Clostridia bacterium]|nr:zinc ribbon domain-containing protein [Clostridia bacterium]
MAYCTNCGAQVDDNAKFCGVCGNKMVAIPQPPKTNARKTTYDGTIHKCPNCGVGLASFVKNCPECGYELRGADGVESASDFARRYASTTSNDKKVDLIRTFVIPNTKEDILEFAILASSNIDTTAYTRDTVVVSGGVSQQDVSEAWMAKFEQAYQKATILLSGTPELKKIEGLYEKKKKSLSTAKVTSVGGKVVKGIFRNEFVKIMLPFILLMALIPLLFGLSECGTGSGEKKLEKQVKQVEAYIAEGNYDAALTTAYSMSQSYSSSWTETRANLISRIKELKGETEGKIPIPNTEYEDKQYADIVLLFTKAGFTNVTAEKVPDLITGWLHSEGEVIEVSIDGSTTFSKGDYCDPNAVVIVRYHGYSD